MSDACACCGSSHPIPAPFACRGGVVLPVCRDCRVTLRDGLDAYRRGDPIPTRRQVTVFLALEHAIAMAGGEAS